MKSFEVELPSNRKFGFFFTGVFAVVGAYFLYRGSLTLAYALCGLSALFFCVTLTCSKLLCPLNKLWMWLGLLIGKIVSPIVLGIIFFMLFTPITYIMRLCGRDELRLKFKSRHTYWKQKEANLAPSETFKNQF